MRRLVVNFAGIGDLVMLTPLLKHLARSGTVELLARPFARELFADQTSVRAVHALAKPNVARGLRLALYGGARTRLGSDVLARAGFDEVLIFRREREVVRAWIRSWIGAGRLVECEEPGVGVPRSEVSRIALASAGYDLAGFDPYPGLEVPAARRDAARARLARFGPRVVAVHPGSSRTKSLLGRGPHLKGLSPEQWAGLLECLLEDGGADSVVVVGSRAEARRTEEITRLVPHLAGRVHDLCGELALGELAAVLAEVEALVSIDSGPAHVAAAVSCPLLEVFGPTDPLLYAPKSRAPVLSVLGTAPCQFCEGTRRWKTCRDNVCLKSLGVETLFAAWRALSERLRFGEGAGVRQSAV